MLEGRADADIRPVRSGSVVVLASEEFLELRFFDKARVLPCRGRPLKGID